MTRFFFCTSFDIFVLTWNKKFLLVQCSWRLITIFILRQFWVATHHQTLTTKQTSKSTCNDIMITVNFTNQGNRAACFSAWLTDCHATSGKHFGAHFTTTTLPSYTQSWITISSSYRLKNICRLGGQSFGLMQMQHLYFSPSFFSPLPHQQQQQ